MRPAVTALTYHRQSSFASCSASAPPLTARLVENESLAAPVIRIFVIIHCFPEA